MTKESAIKEACEIVALVYKSIGDYTYSSDCFCTPAENLYAYYPESSYRNSGEALWYVKNAVIKQLRADGYKLFQIEETITNDEFPS